MASAVFISLQNISRRQVFLENKYVCAKKGNHGSIIKVRISFFQPKK